MTARLWGSARRLACWLESLAVALHPLQRRPRRNDLCASGDDFLPKRKVRDDEGVIASTRGACAPRKAGAASSYLTP
jgi:hypothetical protein